MPDFSTLVKKTNCDAKTSELEKKITNHDHDRYITTPECNILSVSVFNVRLAQANLITKTDFDAKLSSFHRKNISNKSKHLLVENQLKKLKTFDYGYLTSKSFFDKDGSQNYLIFQPVLKCFTLNGSLITGWKSIELSNQSIITTLEIKAL